MDGMGWTNEADHGRGTEESYTQLQDTTMNKARRPLRKSRME
jgi:hypothetical protein